MTFSRDFSILYYTGKIWTRKLSFVSNFEIWSASSQTFRGWTLLMGNTRPECFLKGLKFLGEHLRSLKSISKFDQIFFKIPINF